MFAYSGQKHLGHFEFRDSLDTRYRGLRHETVEAEYWNIATNELTSPKTLGTSWSSSMGKSAGKWASTPPLLPIKSYAAVEPELMKEIEKLQHRQPRLYLQPFATVSRFRSLISFFSLFLRPSLIHSHCLFLPLTPFVPLIPPPPSSHFLRGTQIARQFRPETPDKTATGIGEGGVEKKVWKVKLKGCTGWPLY